MTSTEMNFKEFSQMNGRRETGHEPVRATQLGCLDWDSIDWTKIKQRVEKTQKKIFRDTQLFLDYKEAW